MMQLITPDRHGEFMDELIEMYRLRFRVFKERLDWDVHFTGDMEMDEFDTLRPAYLLQRGSDGQVQGCVRLLPSAGPTMLRDTFRALLDGHPLPDSQSIWESSRFALDVKRDAQMAPDGIAKATYELFAGMIEFGLSRRLTDIVTVTDVRMERLLRRAGWPLRRIAEPKPLGSTRAVAGYLEVSSASLTRVRSNGGLNAPVLWVPVVSGTA